MQELYLRLGQGTALTYGQEDENFKRLKAAIDALEISVAGAGLGTVTSVGLTMPNIFTVTNSPVTTTGSLTATLASQSANRFFASPNGSAGQPTFRSLVANDLPTVTIAKGGLGLTTVATNNQVIASNGTSYEGRTISVGTGLTVTQGAGSILFGLDLASINLTSLGGVLTPSQGGTGVSALPSNGQLLIGNGTGWTAASLTAGTNITITPSAGGITISTLADLITSSGGTANYLPKFATPSTLGDSPLYVGVTGNIGLGTITPTSSLHISKDTPSLNVETTSGTAATIRASSTSASTSATLNSGGNLTTVNTNLTVNTGLAVYPSGNSQFLKGFAIDGFVYFNTTGNYTFTTNEQYGVILGTGSDGTMSVALPATPMDGQEICILCEEAKTLTLTSTYSIYGHNAGVAIPIVLTGGGSGAASLLVKFASGARGGLGAWFITGL
jgi:hypothetical protein